MNIFKAVSITSVVLILCCILIGLGYTWRFAQENEFCADSIADYYIIKYPCGLCHPEGIKQKQPRRSLKENEGEKPIFAENLVKEYGVGILEELRAKRNTSGEIGRKEIEEITLYYKDKLKELEGKCTK